MVLPSISCRFLGALAELVGFALCFYVYLQVIFSVKMIEDCNENHDTFQNVNKTLHFNEFFSALFLISK